jgi:hypothetical protein
MSLTYILRVILSRYRKIRHDVSTKGNEISISLVQQSACLDNAPDDASLVATC